jgi:hypothetical protein
MKTKKAYRDVKFDGKYNDFKTFYDENQEEIYRNIVEIYKGFINNKRKILDLQISAEIDGFSWRTNFKFHKNDLSPLKKDALTFFENIEDYEICHDIINLHKELTTKK